MGGQPGGRRYVDDRAAAAIADRRCAMLHAKHWTGQVDRDRAVPRLDRRIDDALARDRSGVVDENVELAELLQRRGDDLLPRRLVGCVLAQKESSAALAGQPPRQRLAGGNIDVGHDDRSFFAHEEFSFRRPLPARRTGDQRYLARQSCHIFLRSVAGWAIPVDQIITIRLIQTLNRSPRLPARADRSAP